MLAGEGGLRMNKETHSPMPEFYHARARIQDLHREAAARSLAKLAPATAKHARRRIAHAAAGIEPQTSVAYAAVNGALH